MLEFFSALLQLTKIASVKTARIKHMLELFSALCRNIMTSTASLQSRRRLFETMASRGLNQAKLPTLTGSCVIEM